jgi:phage shock protein PspC (stress-responsive transcriptional regulator)
MLERVITEPAVVATTVAITVYITAVLVMPSLPTTAAFFPRR